MTQVTRGVVIDLRATGIVRRDATRSVRQMLVDAGAYSLLHDATLAVTEVTGSVVSRSAGPCRMTASYSVERGRLRVEVLLATADAADSTSADTWLDPAVLPFVGALSTEHGVERCDDGTLVWFEMLQVRGADVPV